MSFFFFVCFKLFFFKKRKIVKNIFNIIKNKIKLCMKNFFGSILMIGLVIGLNN